MPDAQCCRLLVLSALLISTPATGAKIVVGGACSLVDAMAAADTDTATGGCPAGSGADTIHLAVDVPPTGSFPVMDVNTEITVRGHGRTVEEKIFEVEATGSLTLSGADLFRTRVRNKSGGVAEVRDCVLRGSSTPVVSNSGTMTIRSSTITDNHPAGVGTLAPIIASNGTLTVVDSRVVDNGSSIGNPGGIYVASTSSVFIRTSEISGNQTSGAAVRGGGIFNQGTLSLHTSTVADNLVEGTGAAFGGGIANSGTLTIVNSTLSGNEARSPAVSRGGAVYNEAVVFSVTMVNSTVSGNEVTGSGTLGAGGLHNQSTGTFTLQNVIAAGSTGADCTGSFADALGNFGCLGAAVTDLDPELKDNGGPTWTHALLAGSNAINASASCLVAKDQRGSGRFGLCDSGAFELGGCPDDPFEAKAGTLGDNICPGVAVENSGDAQTHNLCDVDWITFNATSGSEYLVETLRLVGGADTLISAWKGCGGAFLGIDDNSGSGLASSLSLVPGGGAVVVLVEGAGGSYGAGKSYDVRVTCVSNCSCPSADGADLDLTGTVVTGPEVFEVCDTLTAGPGVTVNAGGILILAAGSEVVLQNGFTVMAGGSFEAEVDPSLRPLE